jgi:prephenate dehydrogenase
MKERMNTLGFQIGLVGLGMMGSSLAMALKGFRGARIVGSDVNELACRHAVASGWVTTASAHAEDAFAGTDLLIFCVYAHHIPPLLETYAALLKPGSVVSDICGVKSGLYTKLDALIPEGIDYIGIHPMAGKERDGFSNASPGLYQDTGLIIVPLPNTKTESISLMRDLAAHIGATHVALSPPDEHDAIIAYTSDLMHIAAAGLCMDYHPDITSAYTAGAYRDSTRVSDINADAWTELLMDNRINTCGFLDRYITNLLAVRRTLSKGDTERLRALLTKAGVNKREMLKK